MKRQNVQCLIAIGLSAASLGLAACGDKQLQNIVPSQNNTQLAPVPSAPTLNPPMPDMPMTPITPVTIEVKFGTDPLGITIAEIVMTENYPGLLREAMARLDRSRQGRVMIANRDQTVIFACLTQGPGAQCAARLAHSTKMMVSEPYGTFQSYDMNLLDFSGVGSILRQSRSHFDMKISDSTGAYFALVISQTRDDSSAPMISIEGRAGSSN